MFFVERISAEASLQQFLAEANALRDYGLFFQMFNTSFDLQAILGRHLDYLEEPLKNFSNLTNSREIVHQGVLYVHALELVVERGSTTSRLYKKYLSMQDNTKLCLAQCVQNVGTNADYSKGR